MNTKPELCEMSDLPKEMCAHCLGHKLGDEEDASPEIWFGGLFRGTSEDRRGV